MGIIPVVLLLCGLHALGGEVRAQESETTEAPDGTLPANCREEMYPCTRMYSLHRPIKRCVGGLCLYSLPRVYVINNEICTRTVCQHEEDLKGEPARVSSPVVRPHSHLLSLSLSLFVCVRQLSCAGSCPGGPGACRGHPTGNAVAIAVVTPRPGPARPDSPKMDPAVSGHTRVVVTSMFMFANLKLSAGPERSIDHITHASFSGPP
uniref:microfibril associated protein 5 isoform X1 n=1 Tax=Doryrhamphus excisus TaxID=161450 RepID=UPI0025ADBAC1|nr:microfibril associated protein 5 isoform X1 [Doryrhamphus excisus]